MYINYITILNSVVSLHLSLKIHAGMLLYLWNNQSMCISLIKRKYLDGMKKMIYKQKQSRKNWKLELMKVLQYQTMKVHLHVDHCTGGPSSIYE